MGRDNAALPVVVVMLDMVDAAAAGVVADVVVDVAGIDVAGAMVDVDPADAMPFTGCAAKGAAADELVEGAGTGEGEMEVDILVV
jgi:hypothetical protein